MNLRALFTRQKAKVSGLPRILEMDAYEKLVFRVVHCGDWFKDGFHSAGWLVEVESPKALIEHDPSHKSNGGLLSLADAVHFMKEKHAEYARRNEPE